MSSDEILKLAEVTVTHRHLYTLTNRSVLIFPFFCSERSLLSAPAPHGLLDAHLGVSRKNDVCETCHERLPDCAGHFGVVNLALPVFHIGYFNDTKALLERICKSCSRYV